MKIYLSADERDFAIDLEIASLIDDVVTSGEATETEAIHVAAETAALIETRLALV